MKQAAWLYSITSLIVANLVPLYGVWYWNWNVFFLMLLYWLESAIIGFFNVLKMKTAEGALGSSKMNFTVNGRPVNQVTGDFLSGFFVMHYGMFMFVHLIFILVFFFSREINLFGLLISFLSLCLSHYVSYRTHFIDNQEYKKLSPDSLFIGPYPRIIVMNMTIILGANIALQTGEPKWALALMVFFKISADLGVHIFSHWRLDHRSA